jgi:branched-chain amino acid transport system permease protein
MNPLISRFGGVLVLLAIVLLLPLLLTSNYHFRVLSLIFISGLAAIGLNLLMGFAGQVSLGHAGFMGIGAYTVAILPEQLGLSSLGAIWVGALISGLLAFAVGRPILKLKGYYLAVATLGFGFLISQIIGNEAHWTGGPDGMSVPRLAILGWRIRSAEAWYWISGVVLIIGVLIAQNIVNSSTGRALRAIHDSEIAAQVVGVDISRQKLKVFVLSAIYASLAGSLMALSTGHITPDSTAGFLRSIELLTMVVLGGLGSIFGSILGAAILILLPQVLTVFHDYEHLMLGLIMMLCVILLPSGMVPTVQRWLKREAS